MVPNLFSSVDLFDDLDESCGPLKPVNTVTYKWSLSEMLSSALRAVAILRGGLGGPWPPSFLLGPPFGPPSFFLNFPFKFVWLTHTGLPIPAILSTAPDLSCVVIRKQHRENRDSQYY